MINKRLLAFGAVLLVAGELFSAPVSQDLAANAVEGWLRLNPTPLDEQIGREIVLTEGFFNENDEPIFYVMSFKGGGFVVTSTDDLIEPIISFSDSGTFDSSTNNPLSVLLHQDMKIRSAQAKELNEESADAFLKTATPFNEAISVTKEKWNSLITTLGEPSAKYGNGLPAISDLRVAPLLETTWDQTTVGGNACYNYYTPPYEAGNPDNYPSGCGQTAMAMIMHYFRWPIDSIGVVTNTIKVNGIAEERATLGLAYDWDNMPDHPDGGTPEIQRQAIGALTHDIGVIAGAMYYSYGTGSLLLPSKLVDYLGYSNAILTYQSNVPWDEMIRYALNPNLDAKMVVELGISGFGEHIVVGDGYGYNMGSMYHHINMGWGGSNDAWYQLPALGGFSVVNISTYNIYPTGSGEVVSGRIIDTSGNPLDACSVSLSVGGTNLFAATSTNGVYAFKNIPSFSTAAITATHPGYQFCTQTVHTGESGNEAVGNRGEQDFVAVDEGLHFFLTGRVERFGYANGLDGAVVSVSGIGTQTIQPGGTYFMEVPMGWSGTVTVTKDGYKFETHQQTIDPVYQPVWNLDFTGAPVAYVDTDATGSNNGSSWADAYTNLNDACENITTYGSEIWVAEGIYFPEVVSFKPSRSISLYGGFAGLEESRNQRDWTEYPTILDGDIGIPGEHSDNVNGVIYCADEGNMIDGFTIRNGKALSSAGAVYSFSTNNHTIVQNCIITNNSGYWYGGAVRFCTLNNCTLSGNWVEKWGGAAHTCTLNNCTITGNLAGSSGGGTHSSTLNNCIVYGNTASSSVNYGYYCKLSYSCTTPLPTGNGNIATDPLFVDSANGDFQLQESSPCINAGSNASTPSGTDLDGNPRIMDGSVDMGAYEHPVPGDADNDDLPDDWEALYGGDLDPGAICSNGVNTVLEAYVAGLDPTNPDSLFTIALDSGTTLQWNTSSGRVYSVWWSTNLLNSFQPLETNLPWTQTTLTNQAQHPSEYYQIKVQMEQ